MRLLGNILHRPLVALQPPPTLKARRPLSVPSTVHLRLETVHTSLRSCNQWAGILSVKRLDLGVIADPFI